jgi:hypothetical protein
VDLIRDFRVEDADVRSIGLSLYRERVNKYFADKKEFTEAELEVRREKESRER